MKMIGYVLILFYSLNLLAQDISRELNFLETQNTIVDPFSIPLYISSDGDMTLLFRDANSITSFNLLAQAQASFQKLIYIAPIRVEGFGFFNQLSGLEWIETKSERYEAGIGVSAGAHGIGIGLSGYKGALQTMVRIKKTPDEATSRPILPKSLAEIESWSEGDKGSFQRYGGVQLSIGYGVSVVTLASMGVVVQNLWSLGLERLKSGKVALTLAEENLTKRKIQTGSPIASLEGNLFKGNRLSVHFELDPKNKEHHELYRLALKGKIIKLQEKLPLESQKLTWVGSERMGYLGIPAIVGKHSLKSEYILNFDEGRGPEVLDLKAKKNLGLLLPVRNHYRLVYQTKNIITLVWHSFMTKVFSETLEKYFLNPGREMGIKGFDIDLPAREDLGATVSQLSLSFTKSEIESINKNDLSRVLLHFEQRCLEFKLKCSHPKKLKKITRKLHSFIGQDWEKYRDALGFLILENPSLVNSYLKVLNLNKNISFRFLNQKYQSLEGIAPIDI